MSQADVVAKTLIIVPTNTVTLVHVRVALKPCLLDHRPRCGLEMTLPNEKAATVKPCVTWFPPCVCVWVWVGG